MRKNQDNNTQFITFLIMTLLLQTTLFKTQCMRNTHAHLHGVDENGADVHPTELYQRVDTIL